MSDEYIKRSQALKEIRDAYEYEYPTASGAFDEFATTVVPNVLRNIPAADIVTLEDHERMKRELATQLLRTQRLTNQPGLFIPNLEMPCNCLECWFRSPFEEIGVGVGLYKKISRCWFAPEDIEDPWRDVTWQVNHREEFCPLVEMKGARKNDT